MYDNLPVVKLGLVATSRDCFPIQLSAKRKAAVVDAYTKAGGEIVDIPTIIESETDAMKALEEVKANGCNALVVFLGNFGPEGPETMLADKFGGPTMFVAAAEETGDDLIDGRGDAYCGMLNASYSIGLKSLKNVYIPEYPVGTADEIASMICEFIPIAAVRIGLSNLKVFSFGPRPYDFIACNAPIKPLFDLGINIQENSELDLFAAFNDHANDPRIAEVAADMAKELGADNPYAGILPKLAQYEITVSPFPARWTSTARFRSTSSAASRALRPRSWTSTTPCPRTCTSRRSRTPPTTSSPIPSWASTAATPLPATSRSRT